MCVCVFERDRGKKERREREENEREREHTVPDCVKEYVNYVSMSEYGLDCQSRHSKSCVVNDGSLSTEVLRVVVGYRGTRSKLFRLVSEVKRNVVRTVPTGEARVRGTYIRVHFSQHLQSV